MNASYAKFTDNNTELSSNDNNLIKIVKNEKVFKRDKKVYTNNLIELPTQGAIESQGERVMWKAVIMQALVDLSSQSMKKMNKIYRTQAGKWLNKYNKNFLTVCSYAGFSPDFILKKANEIKKMNKFYKD